MKKFTGVLSITAILTALCALAALKYGTLEVSWHTVFAALSGSDDDLGHLLYLMREAEPFQDNSALQKFYILQHDSAN